MLVGERFMCLINDQKTSVAECILVKKKIVELIVALALVGLVPSKVVFSQYHLHQFQRADIGVKHDGYLHGFIQLLNQMLEQGCFSGAHITYDDDKPGLVRKTIVKMVQRGLVLGAQYR